MIECFRVPALRVRNAASSKKPPRRVQVLRRVDAFECQHIATSAWVFAQYDWAPQDALQALANEAERRGADMRPQHISMLLQVPAPLRQR